MYKVSVCMEGGGGGGIRVHIDSVIRKISHDSLDSLWLVLLPSPVVGPSSLPLFSRLH